MKNLIQITTVLLLLVQTIGYGQTKNMESTSKKQATIIKKESTKTEIDTKKLKKFIGTYYLEEANFTLEIIEEDTSFSKDILTAKSEATLHEATRGVYLELIKDNKDALKFTQNGYEAIIKRVKPKKVNKKK